MANKIRKIIRTALTSVGQTSMALIGIMIFSRKIKEKYPPLLEDYIFLIIIIFTIVMEVIISNL